MKSAMPKLPLFFLLLFCFGHAKAQSEQPGTVSLHGYVKYLPSYRNSTVLDKPFFDHLIHNRLNSRFDLGDRWSAQASLRTRYFYGSTVREVPFLKDFLEEDVGYFNISKVLIQGESGLLHSTSDRLFVEYKAEKWQIRAGRQRINWGINLVSNPNDLFNTYSFFDFDYEERPGTDAIRFQYFTGTLSRFEFAYAPGRTKEESVAAALYALNSKGFDYQIISGIFQNRFALGSGFAGSINNTGIKGEISFFTDLEKVQGRDKSNVVASVSADHRFGNGLFVLTEYLYNQRREGVNTDVLLFTQPLSADNLSFTDHSVFVQGSHSISPIFQAGISGFYYPTEQAAFISPNINTSLKTNLDLMLIAQIFFGPPNTIFSQAGTLVAAALKWSF
jgi:hypothetical protein